MDKKKVTIILGVCILIYLILAIGIKFDSTGFHSVFNCGETFINIM